jgi:hypothetical protein
MDGFPLLRPDRVGHGHMPEATASQAARVGLIRKGSWSSLTTSGFFGECWRELAATGKVFLECPPTYLLLQEAASDVKLMSMKPITEG